MKMVYVFLGYYLVIGRLSVNGLVYVEYVIYRGEQVFYLLNKYKKVIKYVSIEYGDYVKVKENYLMKYLLYSISCFRLK